MIGFLRGKLVHKAPPFLVLDVQGVGYEVEAPMTTFYDLPAINEEIKLHTHLVVREDAHILFGFSTEADRTLFRTLIKVNGVGPKLALTILSGQSAEEFHRCIQDNDTQTLVRLPGVGKKTAERLVIEMRDRLPDLGDSAMTSTDKQVQLHHQSAIPNRKPSVPCVHWVTSPWMPVKWCKTSVLKVKVVKILSGWHYKAQSDD